MPRAGWLTGLLAVLLLSPTVRAAGAPTDFASGKQAVQRKCAKLERLLSQGLAVQHILGQREERFQSLPDLPAEDKKAAVVALQLQRRQLQRSQGLVDDTLTILVHILQNITYLDLPSMRSTARTMHAVLAASALEAEEIGNAIDALAAQQAAAAGVKQRANATLRSGVDDVMHFLMKNITESVDKLQDQLHGHETQTFEKEKKTAGVQLETVVRLQPTDPHAGKAAAANQSADAPDGPGGTVGAAGPLAGAAVTTLIDSRNNQYVLRRPTDTTLHYEDPALMRDVALVLGAAFVGGAASAAVGLPAFFGYVGVGILLSPTGLNKLVNIVQVETLGGLGVHLLLFLLGLEFSLPKLLAVWRIAVFGGGGLMAATVALTVVVGRLNGAPVGTGLLLGFCVALSSTAIVVRCLDPYEATTRHGAALLGILVVQDIALGGMLAVLPILHAGRGLILHALQAQVVGLVAVTGAAAALSWRVLPRLFRHLRPSPELTLLGAVAVMLGTSTLTDSCGLSAELGCFLAGLMLAASPALAETALPLLAPVRDVFAAIFFVTMGLHIYPSFLWSQVGGLLTLTAGVVALKYLSALAVFAGYYRFDPAAASLMAVGLAQISEFAFVLASHGRRLGLLSREAYFLLLGTTALSFLATPFLWRGAKRCLPVPAAAAAAASRIERDRASDPATSDEYE